MKGISLLLLEHYFAKKKLKSSSFLKNLLQIRFRGKEVEWVVPFCYWKTFLIMPSESLCFSERETILMLFRNYNLTYKLQFRYVGLLVELSIFSNIACYYCFYYLDSFYKQCFSFGRGFFFFVSFFCKSNISIGHLMRLVLAS